MTLEKELTAEEELEEIKSRLLKYYQKLLSNYEYYKGSYIKAINENSTNPRYETNFNYSKRAIDDCKYYLYKYLEVKVSPDNVDTGVVDDQLPWGDEE